MKHRVTFVSFVVLVSSIGLSAQAPSAPIPAQIASAKTAFLSNAGDADAQTLSLEYNATYSALQSWGKYQLTSTPSDAELILELHYDHSLASTVNFYEQDTLSLHIIDRVTHTILWSITVNVSPGKTAKSVRKDANDIVNALESLIQPNASTSSSLPTKTRFSEEGKK